MIAAVNIVKRIATLEAETLNRLSNPGRFPTSDDDSDDPRTPTTTTFSWMLDDGRAEFMWCDDMKRKLAKSRARETNRDLETTFMEVQYEVANELAKILSETIDPAFAGSDGVRIEDEDGGACGICLEDMEKGEEVRAMGACGHKFHVYCIFRWVKRKQNCPLCRCPLKTKKYF
ncbi:hypothetical protein HRI_004374200 [Hibiscus trionum]|uniref:RING-type domain-containing protein n=1 Tax=Hibiscus trionum TaxID=183268 RepID=A0A9W7J427_HIBTR|nr:hypothetical protein HRI_004374200 [Hibiscus trionum]